MRRLARFCVALATLAVAFGVGAPSAHAAYPCSGHGGALFAQAEPAIDVYGNDTIMVTVWCRDGSREIYNLP